MAADKEFLSVVLLARAGEIRRPKIFGRRAAHPLQMKRSAKELLTTQCFVKSYSGNARDNVLCGIHDEKARAAVMVNFSPLTDSRIGELAARFDLVLGVTSTA